MKNNNLNRTIIVTGGSGGIGSSICKSFANSKNNICFTYYSNEKKAKETAKLINELGCIVHYEKVDVSSLEQVKKFFKFIVEKCGKIDVLINNAGISNDGLLIQMLDKNWSRVIDVNLKGTFNCIKIASKSMLRQKYGRIINISSIVGITGNSGQSNYAASKAGIIGLTKTAAREFGSRNITVNVVAPGYIDTNMSRNLSKENKKKIIEKIPLGRPGKPEDISNIVFFLASNKASYITGQVLSINGGMYM